MSNPESLKPFFTYYGGKWRAAPKYETPKHDQIIEPFAGAAGYSVRHYRHNCVLADSDPVIAGLWAFLIEAKRSDIESLPLLGPDDSLDNFGQLSDDEKSLIGFWLNKGCSAPRKSPSSWMRSGINQSSFWGEVVRERIASQVGLISHWEVHCRSWEDCCDIEGTWFIDPPYAKAGKHYRHGSSGIDYASLGDWCKGRRGQVIVCENEGADWLPFRAFADIKASESRNGGKVSKEVVWTR